MISLLLILFSLNAHAEIQPGRIEKLLSLSEQYHHDGANCFASVVYASGLIDDAAYISSDFYEAAVRTPYCQQLPSQKALMKGDIVVLGSPNDREEGLWMHALLVLGEGNAFAKMGYRKEDKTIVTNLESNIKFYRDQDPQIKSSKFRCNLPALRMALELSDLKEPWEMLLIIRGELFNELRQEQTLNHDLVKQTLNRIEGVVTHSKAPGPLRSLVKALVASTRDQLHLLDNFTVEM